MRGLVVPLAGGPDVALLEVQLAQLEAIPGQRFAADIESHGLGGRSLHPFDRLICPAVQPIKASQAAVDRAAGSQLQQPVVGCLGRFVVAQLQGGIAGHGQRLCVIRVLCQHDPGVFACLGKGMADDENAAEQRPGRRVIGIQLEGAPQCVFGSRIGTDVAGFPGQKQVGAAEMGHADVVLRVGFEPVRPETDLLRRRHDIGHRGLRRSKEPFSQRRATTET